VTTTVEQAMIDPDQTFEVTEVGMNAGRVSSRRHSSRGTRASDASGTRCGHVILFQHYEIRLTILITHTNSQPQPHNGRCRGTTYGC
jgi:hypothetical protein